MKMKAWILGSLYRIWNHLTFQYGMAAAACALATWMQYQYRLQGSMLFLLLPAIGATLLTLNILLVVNQFAKTLPRWDSVRRILTHLEWSAGMLVRAFVYSSLLLYANCILDNTAPMYRSAEIDSEAWRKPLGLLDAYSWVTLRYRDDRDHPMRVLITAQEKARLWGAQPVSVTLKNGMFGIPAVTAIEQDWGWYGNEILKTAPTATTIRRLKIYFDLTHNRWSEGIETGRKSMELNPQDWETAVITGELLFQASRYNDSLPFYEHGFKQHASYTLMQEYGTALNWAGQSPRAAEVLKASIPLDPDNWEAYYHLGHVYGDMAHYEEAIEYFEEGLKRRPHSLEMRAMIAKHREDITWRDSLKRNKAKRAQSPAGS
jgi:tetratricopeptide (TPR) repeat protein